MRIKISEMGKKKITCISMQDLVVRLNNGETPQINLLSSLNISNLWKFFSFPKHK